MWVPNKADQNTCQDSKKNGELEPTRREQGSYFFGSEREPPENQQQKTNRVAQTERHPPGGVSLGVLLVQVFQAVRCKSQGRAGVPGILRGSIPHAHLFRCGEVGGHRMMIKKLSPTPRAHKMKAEVDKPKGLMAPQMARPLTPTHRLRVLGSRGESWETPACGRQQRRSASV